MLASDSSTEHSISPIWNNHLATSTQHATVFVIYKIQSEYVNMQHKQHEHSSTINNQLQLEYNHKCGQTYFLISWSQYRLHGRHFRHVNLQYSENLAIFSSIQMVGQLKFNVPFQHKYSYIKEKRSGVKSHPYPVKDGQRYIKLNPGRLFVQQPPKKGKGSRGSLKLLVPATGEDNYHTARLN